MAISGRAGGVPLRLDLGEPRVPLPVNVRSGLLDAIDTDVSAYPAADGDRDLRLRLVEREREAGRAVDERWLVVTHGASAALSASILALTSPGDHVLVPDPGYPAFLALVEAFGRRSVLYPAPASTINSVEAIFAAGPRPSLLIWNNPSNPTGAAVDQTVCARVVQWARDHAVSILSDEVYRNLVFGRAPGAIEPGSDPLVVSVNSLSKWLAIPGARIGYVVATPETAQRISMFHWRLNMSVAALEQRLAALLVGAAAEINAHVAGVIQDRRDIALELLRAGWRDLRAPDAGLFLWLDVRATGLSGRQFADLCRTELGVLVAPGEAFGPAGAGFIRLSYGADTSIVAQGAHHVAELYARLGR